jgi:hypothetical protein
MTVVTVSVARGDDPADSILSPLGVVDNRLFDEAADSGADWMRVPIQWKFVERGDDNFTFGAEGSWLNELEARNMHMSPVVVVGQCWASHRAGDGWNPTDDPETIPDYPSRAPADLRATYNAIVAYSTTYYDFIFEFVREYGDRIDRLTIENEVNAPNFWEDPIEDYIKVLTTARKAANDADPNVKVFDSGMGSGSWGAPLAEDRYDAGTWDWLETRDWLRAYYDRDVFVRRDFPQLWTINQQSQLDAFFANPGVIENNNRVRHVLGNLFSTELGMMLVDGLNVKYTGEPWMLGELVGWIDERIADSGASPIPVKVNNEASNWCVDPADYNSGLNVCNVVPSDFPILAREMVKKVLLGLDAGVEQSLWFPLSNDVATNEPTPRLGLYDYSGQPTDVLDAHRTLGRFIGGNRDFVDRTTTPNVESFAFNERVLDREDVHVMYWDDGSHGTGSTTITLSVPSGTVFARHYTQAGDSTDLTIVADAVMVPVTNVPSIVYFDDDITPIQGELDPTPAPAPTAWVLGAPTPNPSSGRVSIGLGLPSAAGRVRVDVFDVAGRRVAPLFDGSLAAGTYRLRWEGTDTFGRAVAGGVYFVRLESDGIRQTRKVFVNR